MGVAGQFEELWAVVPFINNWEGTRQVVDDLLAQAGPFLPRVLLLDNGSPREVGELARRFTDGKRKTLLWSHRPPLPSLAASWNQALEFVWATGGEKAWLCNNDIRLAPGTAAALLAQFPSNVWPGPTPLFVSAVGVTEEQFDPARQHIADDVYLTRGGPDFSCFIITKECHRKYPFDEQFIPAYCEDLDYHRRMLLGGDGKRIFSVNVPFLHIDRGSGSLKAMDPEARAKKEEQINLGSRAYYVRKWGGPVNRERFSVPFQDAGLAPATHPFNTFPLTTPELQEEAWRDAEDLSKN